MGSWGHVHLWQRGVQRPNGLIGFHGGVLEKALQLSEVVGLPIDTAGFIAHIKTHLNTQGQKHEVAYPRNNEFSIEPNGDLWLAGLKAKDTVPGVDELTEMIRSRMPHATFSTSSSTC